MTARRGRRPAVILSSIVLTVGLAAPPASAGETDTGPPTAPASQPGPVTETVSPTPARTCTMYGSASGYGMVCSDARGGATLAQLLEGYGVPTSGTFCWDDPDLPDGFEPPSPTSGPGRWWLHTCLSFEADIVERSRARLTYEYLFLAPGDEDELTDQQQQGVELVTGRGQIPFLQVQTSPVSSPRVEQDVAFHMLCAAGLTCTDLGDRQRITTPPLVVGVGANSVTMYAELVHLKVVPEGAARPERAVDCVGAGLPRTAQQLDDQAGDLPGVCRYRYERSSKDAGGGTSGDRYPARVTAFWQIFYDAGDGPQRLRMPYEKTTTNQIRVTEVQTLIVS